MKNTIIPKLLKDSSWRTGIQIVNTSEIAQIVRLKFLQIRKDKEEIIHLPSMKHYTFMLPYQGEWVLDAFHHEDVYIDAILMRENNQCYMTKYGRSLDRVPLDKNRSTFWPANEELCPAWCFEGKCQGINNHEKEMIQKILWSIRIDYPPEDEESGAIKIYDLSSREGCANHPKRSHKNYTTLDPGFYLHSDDLSTGYVGSKSTCKRWMDYDKDRMIPGGGIFDWERNISNPFTIEELIEKNKEGDANKGK